jgi:hypothetical protein
MEFQLINKPSLPKPLYPQAMVLMDPNSGALLGRGPKIAVRGAIITTGASSAYVAIPNTSTGEAPNAVRLATTANCYARLGVPVEATVAAASAGDGYVSGEVVTLDGGTYSSPM